MIEQNEEANNLVIVLPVAGYTTQAPLLHSTTRVFFTKVLMYYTSAIYSRQGMSALNEEGFTRNVQIAIGNAIKNKKYSNHYVGAKSIEQ